MKKKLCIVLIIIFLILVGVLLTISIYKNNKKPFEIGNNEIISEGEIEHNEKEENILENIVVEENIEVSDKNETEKVEIIEKNENKTDNQNVSEKNNTSTTETSNKANNKVNNKETTIKKNTTTTTVSNNANSTSKNEEKKEPIITEKPKEDIAKEDEKTTTDKATTNNTKTEEIIETPKCKHSNENYYNTEEEAIAFYKKTSKEYGDKVKSGEITYEEYLKKCPYGYETMSCPYCQKWTISFYYE